MVWSDIYCDRSLGLRTCGLRHVDSATHRATRWFPDHSDNRRGWATLRCRSMVSNSSATLADDFVERRADGCGARRPNLGHLPLVVISHGNGGGPASHADLAPLPLQTPAL